LSLTLGYTRAKSNEYNTKSTLLRFFPQRASYFKLNHLILHHYIIAMWLNCGK